MTNIEINPRHDTDSTNQALGRELVEETFERHEAGQSNVRPVFS